MTAVPLTLDDVRVTLDSIGTGSALEPSGSGSTLLSGITHDSRDVAAGDLFACLPGSRVDGHDFAPAAVSSGAGALLVERRLDPATVDSVPQLIVDDARRCLGPVAALVHGHPSRGLRTVGITGTNGKTTTAQMLSAILEHAGLRTGVVGTLHGERTTPEATDLQRRLRNFADDGCTAAVLEVSSHALALHRVDGTEFDVVVFTNLGHDHLDLHGSREEYFRAKASLFVPEFAPVAVINLDDAHGLLLSDAIAARGDDAMQVVTYSMDDAADLRLGVDRLFFRWRGVEVKVAIGGRFNVSNALAALTAAVELGLDPDEAAAGLDHLPRVPGRFEVVSVPPSGAPTVVVDYAHTPDGLEELLETARPLSAGGRLMVVFGCGGERDHAKRPEMGRVAQRLADVMVVTSDNPRQEDPERIIDDIVGDLDRRYGARLIRNADRRAAIASALEASTTDDVVVIAGKGHETTQDLGSHVVDFDDRVVVRELLEDPS